MPSSRVIYSVVSSGRGGCRSVGSPVLITVAAVDSAGREGLLMGAMGCDALGVTNLFVWSCSPKRESITVPGSQPCRPTAWARKRETTGRYELQSEAVREFIRHGKQLSKRVADVERGNERLQRQLVAATKRVKEHTDLVGYVNEE